MIIRYQMAGMATDNPMLTVRELTSLQRLPVARLMARLKPDLWDVQEAMNQLSGCHGWILAGPDGVPAGWLAVRSLPAHRSVEIECLGYDALGTYCVGPVLAPLLDVCERWSTLQGMINIRYITGSKGLSCHNKKIVDPGQELKELASIDREDFDWLISMGYQACGILPEVYGNAYHGVLLVKVLNQDISDLLAKLSL